MPPFTLDTRMHELVLRRAALVERQALADNYVRLRLYGADLVGFDSPGADDHIRLFFPGETIPGNLEDWRALPSREYTPLRWDGEEGWLELEFLLHGDNGVASVWAGSAEPGSVVGVAGPRGSKILSGKPTSWLLAGDETALPAIRRWLEVAGERARGHVLVEVADPARELVLDTPDGIELTWVHRHGRPAGAALGAALEKLSPLDPGTFVFVGAEQSIVKPGRELLNRSGIDPTDAVVKGYWKRGETEYHAPH